MCTLSRMTQDERDEEIVRVAANNINAEIGGDFINIDNRPHNTYCGGGTFIPCTREHVVRFYVSPPISSYKQVACYLASRDGKHTIGLLYKYTRVIGEDYCKIKEQYDDSVLDILKQQVRLEQTLSPEYLDMLSL